MDLDLIRLSLVPGLSPRAAEILLDAFESPGAALRARPRDLDRLTSLGKKLRENLLRPPGLSDVKSVLEKARRMKVRVLSREDDDYPERLLQIPDPPLVLYARGEVLRAEQAVAVVGARRASVYGRAHAELFARALARSGVAVVSGLARGVDAAAHEGALSVSGRTIAVLGSGLDRIYPPEHGRLAKRISGRGLLVSEFPFGTPPLSWHFPMRNRIIAGLSSAVVVTEGKLKSGSLITARMAAEFGRLVFALPGRVDTELSRGPHSIIREGAILVETPEHVLTDIDVLPLSAEPEPDRPTDPLQQRLLAELDRFDPIGVDAILTRLEESVPAVQGALLALELSGRVRVLPGRMYVRTQ